MPDDAELHMELTPEIARGPARCRPLLVMTAHRRQRRLEERQRFQRAMAVVTCASTSARSSAFSIGNADFADVVQPSATE